MAESVAPWRHILSTAMQANAHLKHSLYLQLATVRQDGRPANRTVVFRGFIDGSDMLQFTTDRRSHKIEEIQNRPFGEACWYFTDSWEQFRIQGNLGVISSTETEPMKLSLREKAWFVMSLKARLQFLCPPPGHPFVPSAPVNEVKLDPSQGPVDSFCLATLDAEEVDYLHLKNNQRVIFTRNRSSSESFGSWNQQEVNP